MRDPRLTVAIAVVATAVVGLVFGWKSMCALGAVLVAGFAVVQYAYNRGRWK